MQVDKLPLHRQRPGQTEKILHDPVQPVRLLDEDLQEFIFLVAGAVVVPEDLRRPFDGAERIPDFMGEDRGKLTKGGHPFRAPELFFYPDYQVRLALQPLERLLQTERRLLQLHPPLLFPLGQKAGDTADNIVQNQLQVFLQLQGWLIPPLKNDVRDIQETDDDGGEHTAAQPEPEGGENDREIVEPLKDVMQHRQMQRREVVKEADTDDGCDQHDNAHDAAEFHDLPCSS